MEHPSHPAILAATSIATLTIPTLPPLAGSILDVVFKFALAVLSGWLVHKLTQAKKGKPAKRKRRK